MKTIKWSVCICLVGLVGSLLGVDVWPEPPITISTLGVNAESPQVAVDVSKNQVAIWIEDGVVVSRTRPFGGSWGAMEYLSSTGSSAPLIVVDPNAKATAVWLNNGEVITAEKVWGGSWSLPETLTGVGVSDHQMAIDVLGNIVLVWLEGGVVQVKTKPVGSIWSASATSVSGSGALSPSVAVENNCVIVVWEGSDQAIYSAHAVFAGSWSLPVMISDAGVLTCNPRVSVNVSGDALASWFRFDENGSLFSNVSVQAVGYSGGTWGSPEVISAAASVVDPHQLQLAIKNYYAGTAIAAWTSSYDGSYYNIEWTILRAGAWEMPATLIGTSVLPSFGLDIGAQNYAYLIGTYLEPSDNNIWLYGGLANLKVPIEVEPYLSIFPWWFALTGNSCCPAVAVSRSGSAELGVMVWKNYDGVSIVIQSTQAKIPVLLPPTNLQVSVIANDYNVLVQYDNELSWSASLSVITTGYIIYRNGVFLARVPATQLSYRDINQGNEQGTYTMFSISEYGLTSALVQLNFP